MKIEEENRLKDFETPIANNLAVKANLVEVGSGSGSFSGSLEEIPRSVVERSKP